ncbi:hypothetical protein JHD50_00605 [Sulfurimonas sp. MAG313]|nr:hypothetical protein [Sulfurimonas sp. MAG313]MDF1879814.1 hypothetical protein [Sulfurimonas sp. MAG313]
MFKLILLLFVLTFSLFAANTLTCTVVNDDEILKIKCKYNTVSKDYDRNISISWTSPTTHHDDRMKTLLLPAYNKSVYDYRYFDGRAEGSWTITVTDEETNSQTSTEFIKEDLKEAITPTP